jgi:hypothetical protein
MGKESSLVWVGTMVDDSAVLEWGVTRRPRNFIIAVLTGTWAFDIRLGWRYNTYFGADVCISTCVPPIPGSRILVAVGIIMHTESSTSKNPGQQHEETKVADFRFLPNIRGSQSSIIPVPTSAMHTQDSKYRITYFSDPWTSTSSGKYSVGNTSAATTGPSAPESLGQCLDKVLGALQAILKHIRV